MLIIWNDNLIAWSPITWKDNLMIEKAYFSPKNTGEEMLSSSSDCIKSFLRFTLKNKRQGALHEGWQDTTPVIDKQV